MSDVCDRCREPYATCGGNAAYCGKALKAMDGQTLEQIIAGLLARIEALEAQVRELQAQRDAFAPWLVPPVPAERIEEARQYLKDNVDKAPQGTFHPDGDAFRRHLGND